jgi:hypothetical protein
MLGIKGPCPLLAESPGGTFEQPPQEIVKPKESKTMNELYHRRKMFKRLRRQERHGPLVPDLFWENPPRRRPGHGTGCELGSWASSKSISGILIANSKELDLYC